MAKAFAKIQPDVVCVSISDRELAEVRMSLREGDADESVDYVPESRRVEPVPEQEEDGDEDDGDDDEDDEDEEDDEEDLDDDELEVEVPAGFVKTKVVREALDEPFAADLVAADSATRGDQVFVSDTDMTYSRKLAVFGDVELPPPSYMEAVRLADGEDIPVEPIDLDDNEYTIVFCDNVTYWMLVRHSRKVRRMRRRLRAQSPKEMLTEWDRRVRSIKGFEIVEREREKKMAASLLGQLELHHRVLAIIELPRIDGTLEQLSTRVKG